MLHCHTSQGMVVQFYHILTFFKGYVTLWNMPRVMLDYDVPGFLFHFTKFIFIVLCRISMIVYGYVTLWGSLRGMSPCDIP